MPLCSGILIEEASIDGLQEALGDGRLTSVQLVECYLQRLFQVEGYINIARTLDTERVAGNVRGPLHGIPFLLKDNIASKDKLQTTAGSWALYGSIVPRDAFVVAKMREAGAILMGKAALSEWADMRSTDYSEGYSARGSQARSSYNLTVNPSGSSSGSAIAVANNVVPFSLGTETDGSVINPAERNAIVGIKPTVGLTSRAGTIPESLNQDTVGTFGKTVRDAVYALDAIYGIDPLDNATSAQAGKTPEGGYTPFLSDRQALKGATFGLPWKSLWALADPEQLSILTELLDIIQQAGATIINNTEIPYYGTIVSPDGWDWDYGTKRGYPNESEYTYIKVDFYNNIRTYLSELQNTDIQSLEDIVNYNYENDGSEGGHPNIHPAFASGQDGFLASLETRGIMNSTYFEALNFCQESTRGGIDAALKHNTNQSVDALLVPPDVAQSYQIAAQAGYPMITIPAYMHSKSGMPFGLAFMGSAFSEAALISYASAVEDLQSYTNTKYKRTMPRWLGYRRRNIPVDAQCAGC
ncbi:MAG: hypothetical protein Q9174_005004 [Haloplaca sp. 1 TL-2023]